MKLKSKKAKNRNIEYYINRIISKKSCKDVRKNDDSSAKYEIADFLAESINSQIRILKKGA